MATTAHLFVTTEATVLECCNSKHWVEPLDAPWLKQGIDPATGRPKEYEVWSPRDIARDRAGTAWDDLLLLRGKSAAYTEVRILQLPESFLRGRPFLLGNNYGDEIGMVKYDGEEAKTLFAQFFDGEMPAGAFLFAVGPD